MVDVAKADVVTRSKVASIIRKYVEDMTPEYAGKPGDGRAAFLSLLCPELEELAKRIEIAIP